MKKKEDLSDFEHGTDVCLTVSVPDGLLGRSSQQPLKFTGNGLKNRKSPVNTLRFIDTLLRF